MDISTNYKTANVAVTTTVGELVALNQTRRALILFNQGTENAQISISDEAQYIELEAGKGMHFPVAPINAFNVKTASGTTTVIVMEG